MTLVALLFALCAPGFAQESKTQGENGVSTEGVEKDNPFERLQMQEREYGKVTPAYRNRVLDAAKQHNARLNRNTNSVAAGTPGQPTTGPQWINIGPFGQQFGQNGTWTGEETDSGRLRTILVHPTDPNTVYILSSAGGLWRTNNFESATPNWTPLTDFLPTTAGGAAAFGRTPDVIYLGLGDPYDQITVGGSIVKSTDGGNTWSDMIPLGMTISVRDVKVDTTGPTDVVLVATDGGVFRSIDNGATYTQVTGTAFQDQFIWSLAQTSAGWVITTQETQPIANGTCGIGYRWCIGAGHIYLSTDQGATWAEQTNGIGNGLIGRTTLAVAVPGDNVIYALAAVTATNGSAALDTKDVFRSADGGKTWVALGVNSTKIPVNPVPNYSPNMNVLSGQAWYNQTILVDPTDATRNTVFVGGTLFSARSTDGGVTWRVLSEWLPGYAAAATGTALPYIHADMHAMAFKTAGTQMVLLGSDGGIFASTDKGDTWTSSKNTNLVTHMFYSIIGNPAFPNFAMGGLQDNGSRVRLGNTGIFNQSLGGDGFGVGMSQANMETSFQSVYYNKLQRWRTRVPAENYTQSALSLSGQSSSISPFNTPIFSPAPLADPTGLIFFSQGLTRLYKTVNGGLNWSAFSTIGSTTGLSGVSFRDSPFGFSVSPTNINHFAVGTNGGRVYVSLDGGASWTYHLATDAVQGWPGFVSGVSWVDDNTIWVASNSQSEGLYTGIPTVRVVKSTDQGATWAAAGFGLPDIPVTRVIGDPRDINTAYAATQVGVYRTTDGGASWSPYGSGLPNVRVNDIYMPPDGGYLRIATYGRGIWQLSTIDFVSAALVDDRASCDNNGTLGNSESGTLNLTFSNASSLSAVAGTVTVTSDNPHLVFDGGNVATLGTVAGNGTVTGSISAKVVGATGIETANLTITYGDSALVTIKRPISINLDDNANASGTTVTWESLKSGWNITFDTPYKMGDINSWVRRELSPVQHTMAVTDGNGTQDTALVSPVLSVSATNNLTISFNHRFVFENGWDGGVVEISTDNGATWNQVTTGFTAGGYTKVLNAGAPGVGGKSAWTSSSTGWPNYTNVAIDLGTAYAGQNVQIRFRAGADSSTGAQGWEISDVTIGGITNTPFGAIVAHNELCTSSMSMVSSANPSNYPDAVALTATVGGGVTPASGTVTFKEGATVLGTAEAANNVATLNTATLSVGTHFITASYAGDTTHTASASTTYKHTVLAVPRSSLTLLTLDFGDVAAGATSAVQTSVLKNSGSNTLTIASITASGDFAVTHNCSTNIAANGTCTLSITFKPVGNHGARTGAVTVTSNAISGDSVVALTGNSLAAEVSTSAASLSFANTVVGATAAGQSLTITNAGNAPLTIATVAITGNFAETDTCAGATLNASESCAVAVTFAPTTAGSLAGALVITTNAANSPHSIALTGVGDAVKHAQSLDRTTITYPTTFVNATSAAEAVVITNTGNVPLVISSITSAPAAEFPVTGNCTTTPVAVGGTCSVSIKFVPAANGNRAGTLTITSDAAGSPQTVALTGKAQFLAFAGTTTQTVSVQSTATFPLTITGATTGPISLACSGAPARTTCSFDNASVTLTNGSAAVKVIVTPAPTTTSARLYSLQPIFAMLGFVGLALLPVSRKKLLTTLLIALLAATMLFMVACGGGSPKPAPPTPTPTQTFAAPGTYTLTVTATSGSTTLQTQTLTLTLQ